MMMYNKIVEDCFFHPKHVGVLDLSASLTGFVGSKQGLATIELYMQCSADGIIDKVCFRATGHPYLIAGLEWCCRQIKGQTIDSLAGLNYQLLVEQLTIPMEHYPIALQVVQVYKEIQSVMRKHSEDLSS